MSSGRRGPLHAQMMPGRDGDERLLIRIASQPDGRPPKNESEKDRIAKRDVLILRLLSHGMRYDEIARILGYTFWTIKERTYELKRQHKAKTTAHLIAEVMRKGIIN